MCNAIIFITHCNISLHSCIHLPHLCSFIAHFYFSAIISLRCWLFISILFIFYTMCKGAVPLRYHQPTFHENNFYRPRWTNIPSCNNCHLPQMSTSTVMSSCGSQKKLPSIQKKTNFFIHAKSKIKSWHMQALHYVFLSFSFCQLLFCLSTFQKYP